MHIDRNVTVAPFSRQALLILLLCYSNDMREETHGSKRRSARIEKKKKKQKGRQAAHKIRQERVKAPKKRHAVARKKRNDLRPDLDRSTRSSNRLSLIPEYVTSATCGVPKRSAITTPAWSKRVSKAAFFITLRAAPKGWDPSNAASRGGGGLEVKRRWGKRDRGWWGEAGHLAFDDQESWVLNSGLVLGLIEALPSSHHKSS